MFWTRLLSGIVLLAILIGAISLGGPVLYFLLLVISLVGMFELFRAAQVRGEKENALTVTAYLGAAVYYVLIYLKLQEFALPALICAMIGLLFVYVFGFPKYTTEQTALAFFGIVYVAVCLSCIYLTRMLPGGEALVWLIVISSWGCDTMAYCTGRLFGRHKMAPVLSPKKSVEGAVGGVFFAALFGALYDLCLIRFLGAKNQVFVFALICGAGALISMVGDLAASAIKRNHDRKDFGTLIPGHGGILDRFDSVIITAPIIYLLACLFR